MAAASRSTAPLVQILVAYDGRGRFSNEANKAFWYSWSTATCVCS
jgi:hypothetical protein